ncbi:MAG: hypothetical protein V6Z82_05420 [Flavobacteriales bacterium]
MPFWLLSPLVGLILLIRWSFGDGERIEKRNWARGRLLLMLCIAIVFWLLLYRYFGIHSMRMVPDIGFSTGKSFIESG